MSGAFASNRLAEGQLAGPGTTVIYTAPGATIAYIHVANFVNRTASATLVVLYLTGAGAAREVGRATLQTAGWRFEYIDERPLHMKTGDTLSLSISSANNIDYLVTGVEET